MRPSLASSIASVAAWSAGQAYAEALKCQTIYGATSSSKVPTRTTTTTVNIPVYSDTAIPSTVEFTMTTSYISVVGKKTITIPTGSSFTLLTDAPITIVTRGRPREKDFAQAPSTSSSPPKTPSISSKKPFTSSRKTSTSSFKKSSSSSPKPPSTSAHPQSVLCTTTATEYHTTVRTEIYPVTGTTWLDQTSTLHVATSTAYAACVDPDNTLTLYQGKPIQGDPNVFGSYNGTCGGASGSGFSQGVPSFAAEACLNARACCEGAQRYNYTGWTWENSGGIHGCTWFDGYWVFTTGYDGFGGEEGGTWGNGPVGTGYNEEIVFID